MQLVHREWAIYISFLLIGRYKRDMHGEAGEERCCSQEERCIWLGEGLRRAATGRERVESDASRRVRALCITDTLTH